MVVAINKNDLKNNSLFTVEDLHKQNPWIKANNIPVIETSAKTGENVDELYFECCRQVRNEQLQNYKAKSTITSESKSNCSVQ